jgi:hypothetical protein
VHREYKNVFSKRKFLALMLALIITILIDTSLVKVNDLIDKNFISLQNRQILFSINSSLCVLLQILVIRYIQKSFREQKIQKTFKDRALPLISLISSCVLGAFIGLLIFQMLYNGYYDKVVNISIVVFSYGISATFIVWLAILFVSWYRSRSNFIVFLYFIATLLIAFNLIMTSAFVGAKINDRPDHIGEFIGSSGDISGGRHAYLDLIYRTSSFIAFFSIWLTTVILMNSYREKLFNPVLFWVILLIPLVYFLITFFYQFTLGRLLFSYLQIDPISVSIILSAFLSLSKPIGGLVFGIAFWTLSREVSYERSINTYMIISGWGIFLIFAANQAAIQIVNPYPPFGLATITVLNIAGYLMLLGIYNSASLVSTNNSLRKSIRQHAIKSNLLEHIGHAEMEKEIQKTVTEIIESQDIQDTRIGGEIELDEKELRRYIDIVIKEAKKEETSTD